MDEEVKMAKETSEDEFKYYTQKAGDIARQRNVSICLDRLFGKLM